jgi:oligopeptide/dipeptide ABC transporter ATP-binding protein
MRPALLSLEHVAVDIKGLTALTDVTFDVARGSCLGLVGETGSGKSLTCRVISGMLPRIGGQTTAGSVRLEGRELVTLSETEWRTIRGRKIALVPQASMTSLDPVVRVGRQLKETIRHLDPEADADGRTIELLEHVHMARPREVARLYPHELSGGMRQRVMIALALVGRPELLLADEPTTALDVTVQKGILALLEEIRRETEMSIILVTHDLAVVQSVADSIAVMYSGRVVETGTSDDVLSALRPGGTTGVVLSSIPGAPPGLTDRPSGCAFHPRCVFSAGRERCVHQTPALAPFGADGHRSACHFAREVAA